MQVPVEFAYERAASVSDAIALLTRHGPESRLVAGGHSLIPMMKLRLADPDTLIDINGLTELTGIGHRGDHLRIGAMVRHTELLRSTVVGEFFPILHDAERLIADPVVRNRGTVGGSVCQADPSEDLSAALSALRAEAVIEGEKGRRVVPLREFHRGPYQTCIGDAEILVEVRIPVHAGQGSAYTKVKRRVGDWAVAGVGAALLVDGNTVTDVGIGLTAVGAEHFVAAEAEEFLRGGPATVEAFTEAGRIAADHSNPTADQRGPVDYKRHLVGELVVRALRSASDRITGQQEA
jgi:aerobic carbon-monoxide dehydrogenase medium subunit